MAKSKMLSIMLTQEEEKEITEFVKQQMMSTGEVATKSSVARDAIFRYIRNGNPTENKQEPTEKPAEQPTESNPFADISLD